MPESAADMDGGRKGIEQLRELERMSPDERRAFWQAKVAEEEAKPEPTVRDVTAEEQKAFRAMFKGNSGSAG